MENQSKIQPNSAAAHRASQICPQGGLQKWKPFLLLTAVLALLLGTLFHESFDPEKVLFANDGPLGVLMNPAGQLPENFTGIWQDTNWLGGSEISAPPNISNLIRWSLGPIGFAKFYAPLALLFLGWTAWIFFRSQGFVPIVCALGALAATLNMNTFSNACWGLPSRALALGAVFLALSALTHPGIRPGWARWVFAGFGVGLSILEGYDNGAIFSLFVGIFAVYRALTEGIFGREPSNTPHTNPAGTPNKGTAPDLQTSQTPAPINWGALLAKALGGAAVVALVAALVSSHAVLSVISTQLESKGSPSAAGTAENSGNDAAEAQRNWDWATQWSLPKLEALRVVIPGLFGYRMDSSEGGNYWGTVGRQPGWEEHHQGLPRHSGSGEYLGLGVALMAFWGLLNSFRGARSQWSMTTRSMVWFWAAVAVISLVLSFGRHAPFYKIIYSLPYFSTVRNPIKFMHVFHLAALILFGYGLQAFAREFLSSCKAHSKSNEPDNAQEKISAVRRFKIWWKSEADTMQKLWIIGVGCWMGVSCIGWAIFASYKTELSGYLIDNGFGEQQVKLMHDFSVGEVGWFVIWSFLFAALTLACVWGRFRGKLSRIALVLMGLFIVTDLARANHHWIVAYNYQERFSSNFVVDALKEEPQLHRVVAPALLTNPRQASPFFETICREWIQHHFQYFGVHALEIIQMPRTPKDYNQLNQAFNGALGGSPNQQGLILLPRLWQLTNTRYVLGLRALENNLNGELDPIGRRFQIKLIFNIEPADNPSGYQIVNDPNGHFALYEFTGALPRICLFNTWKWEPSDETTLKRLTDLSWNPESLVLVNPSPAQTEPIADSLVPPATRQGQEVASESGAGPISRKAWTQEGIEYLHYQPKNFRLKVTNKTPSILLINDKFNPDWKAFADGKPIPVLRLNFIMRGIYLEEPGEHEVEFVYAPSNNGLWTTVASGLACLGLFIWVSRKSQPVVEAENIYSPAN